jgi:hypothetical protein
MKKSTPLPRTRSTIALLFFLFTISNSFAQSNSDKTAIKEWLVANKDKMTLVTMKEYQTMSPAVKAVLDADSKTLIYNTEVTMDNIYAFENKNVGKNLVPFRTEREKANETEAVARASKAQQDADLQAFKAQEEANVVLQERQNAALQIAKAEQERIDIWRNDNPDLKIISYQDYISRSKADQNEMKANGLLVCEGDKLTLKDIERFQKGQILPDKQ